MSKKSLQLHTALLERLIPGSPLRRYSLNTRVTELFSPAAFWRDFLYSSSSTEMVMIFIGLH
jgi:hypothetical protein